MKKIIQILVLIILTATMLSACSTPETVTQAPAEPTPLTEATSLPTQAEQAAPIAPIEPPSAAPVEPQVTAISGQTLLEERCGKCHAIEKATRETGTFEEWEKIVDNMISRGAQLTDEERVILVQFLADNYK